MLVVSAISEVNLEIKHLNCILSWTKLLNTYLGEQKYELWVRYSKDVLCTVPGRVI